MQTQNTLLTLLNYHWCLSSDTFDYKSDRIVFVLERPLISPKVCHIVMGRSGKGLVPGSRYTQRLREAERASGTARPRFHLSSLSRLHLHGTTTTTGTNSLNNRVETWSHRFFSMMFMSWLTEFFAFQWVTVTSMWTDFVSSSFFWKKPHNYRKYLGSVFLLILLCPLLLGSMSLITELWNKNLMANVCESFSLLNSEIRSKSYTYPISMLFLAWAYLGDKWEVTGLELVAFLSVAILSSSHTCQGAAA